MEERCETLARHSDRINNISFSRDGKYLASCSDDKYFHIQQKIIKLYNLLIFLIRYVMVWDVIEGLRYKKLRKRETAVHCVSYGDKGVVASSSGQFEQFSIFYIYLLWLIIKIYI